MVLIFSSAAILAYSNQPTVSVCCSPSSFAQHQYQVPLSTFSPWSLCWLLGSLMQFFAAMPFVMVVQMWHLELDQSVYDTGGVRAEYRRVGAQEDASRTILVSFYEHRFEGKM
jgi:hypothetical protein